MAKEREEIKDLPEKDKGLSDESLGNVIAGTNLVTGSLGGIVGMKQPGFGQTAITYTGENDIDEQ